MLEKSDFMDEFNYKKIMRKFYAQISDFIRSREDVEAELYEKSRLFSTLEMDEEEKNKISFDWFIFDCKSEVLSKNLLSYFLNTDILDEKTKTIYRSFLNNVYSIFEVKALRIGKEMIIHDLIHDREYNVKDTSLTKHVEKGQCVILRLLPIHGYYILTGIGHALPIETRRVTKLLLQNRRKSQKNLRLSPLEICEMFFAQEKRERLPVRERLILFCQELGLKEAYIEKMVNTLKEHARDKGEYGDIFKDLFNKIIPYPNFKPDEVTGAFIDLWNSFISEEEVAFKPGPTEEALVHACIGYARSKVNPDKYKDVKKAETRATKLSNDWLNTAREELDGKTPKEVILEERKRDGNPRKEVAFTVSLTKLEPGADVKRQAEELFYKGFECIKQNEPIEAIKAYRAYCALNSKNCVVWQNMGVAYMLLLEKNKAQECFEKALEINPDYKMPKNNLKLLKNANKKDLERIAKGRRIKYFNKGE